ncbi:hypothetical protein CARN8_7070001 [mine drainage metagenome]|uniref:Uncharacterized protein n=1 Tax=mine drainage metagenome TaxID=410659 RepID=A0A3P3ZRI9_9ZZZZ
MILSKPYPDTVVVGSHIEVIIFGIFRALLFRKRPNIVLLGFIFTHRPQPLANWLRGLYFRFVFSIADQDRRPSHLPFFPGSRTLQRNF